MIGLTGNEAKVMDYMIRNFDQRNSINQIARKLNLSPNGAYKILKKLEKNNYIKPERINNGICYKPNLEDVEGRKLAEYILSQKNLNTYAKVQAEDLMQLEDISLGCILFGSVLRKGKEARDVDVIIIMEKKDFDKVYGRVKELKEMKPKKIHAIYLLRDDFFKQIVKKDEMILSAIRKGQILWGSEIIMEAIKNVAR